MQRRQLARLAIALLALTRAPSFAQEVERPKPAPNPVVVEQGLGKELDLHVSALAALGFNGSVLVSKAGKVILCKGYGLADRAKETANGPDTLFDIGSLTKQFTAAAVMKLAEEKQLKPSDLLSKYVGEVPKDKAAITLHHLLTHTSGLPREVRVGSWTTERDALVKEALATKLRSAPGAEFCYANAGYDLLGAVVEIVSKQSFEDYVKRELFLPAELRRTTFLGDASVDVPSAACGYEGSGGVFPAQQGWYSWGLRGAGGVLSSVVELEHWWRALDGGKVLSQESRKELFAPELMDYACGWWVRDGGDLGRVIEHAGTTRGFEASLARYPDKDLLVIVLSNERETCKPTASSLARAAAGLPYEKPPVAVAVDPERLRMCEGSFVAGKSALIEVHAVGARLALTLSPEAVVLLSSGREAKSLSQNPKLAERIAEILFCLRSRDAAGLVPLISTEYAGWNQQLVGVWGEWCVERGAYERHEVLGTDRFGDLLRAFVAIDFAGSNLTLAMNFSDDRFSGFEVDADVPHGPVFAARSESEFAWLDTKSFGGRTCELYFERDAKGRTTTLAIRTGASHSLRAKRKK